MHAYLGIDCGTSGLRGCLVDAHAARLAQQAVALPAPVRDGPAVSQDAELWWTALTALLDALAGAHELAQVAAVCIDGTSASLLLCDDAGTPRGPALMYNDARATEQAERLGRLAPPDSVTRSPGSSLAKLLWLLQSPAADGARHALHQADWLTGRLCGTYGLSDENNALKLGYDPQARDWPAWLARLPVDHSLLPRVLPAGVTCGQVTAAHCARWGFQPGTRVISGTTDSTASFIATGAGPGDAVTALGSTLVLKVLGETVVNAPAYGVYSHRLGEHWLVGGASNCGGAVLAQHFSPDEMARLTARLDPDTPTGLDYYPLPATGERFPVNDPQRAPRLAPRPADDARFFQGLLEGLAAVEAQGYHVLETLGAPHPRRVLTTGGGAVNEPWRVLRERALGIPVIAAAHQDAAYGAALLALRSTSGT